MVKARLNAEYGEAISAINLSGDSGVDVDTFIGYDGESVFDVATNDLLDSAMYNYILFDHRTNIVYAVQSIDLEFV